MENLPAKRRGRKAGQTLEVVRKRRNEIAQMLIKGETREDIIDSIQVAYQVSVATIDNDIGICHDELREVYNKQQQHIVAVNHARLERLFNQWDRVDGNLQLKVIQEQNKMAGIYRNEQPLVQVNSLNLSLENLSVDELKNLLNNKENER